jgi:hypothetical protein
MTKKKKIVLISLILLIALFLIAYFTKDFLIQQNNVVKLDCPKELSYNKKGKENPDVIKKINSGTGIPYSWNTSCGRIYKVVVRGGDFGYAYYDYKGDRIVSGCDAPFSDSRSLGKPNVPFANGGPICNVLRQLK